MTNPSTQANDVTMSGGGLYSQATIGAKHVIDAATPLVLQALQEVPIDDDVFTLSDMGCADGGTSLEMVGQVLKAVRQMAPKLPIQVVYADQPRNDFNALVKIVHGLTEFESFIGKMENIYPLFSGTSFYNQIVASNALNLGFSATAMHWLSTKPCNISNHVHAVGAQNDELSAFKLQAKKDWQTILLNRAAELRSGGQLVLVNFCRDQQGRYLGNTNGVNMFDTFNQIWQEKLSDNIISNDEYLNMTLPQYYNSVEEFIDPFEDKTSVVYQAGLRLSHIETRVIRCPFAADFEQHGNAKEFARAYIPTIRSWNESIFAAGLAATRSADERKEIIEDYYGSYQYRVVDNPQGHGMDYVHAYMVIRKIADS